MAVEDRPGEEAEKLGELLLPDVEMRHLFGEMIEQPRMMGERENDGDGEAVGEGSGIVPLLPADGAAAASPERRSACRCRATKQELRLHVAAVVLLHPGIGDGVEQLIKPLFERRAPLGRIESVARAFALPQNIDERPRLSETVCEGAGALVAHKVVGIRALRQESEAEGMAFTQNRQHAVDGARGGSFAGPVAVEADDGFGREQPKLIHLALGESGAERRDGLWKPA